MQQAQVERRTSQRLPIQVPITIRDANGSVRMVGTTRDVSSHGIFFVVKSWCSPIQSFEFTLTFPPSLSRSLREVHIYGDGKVVRVQQSSLNVGVAAIVEHYRLGGVLGTDW